MIRKESTTTRDSNLTPRITRSASPASPGRDSIGELLPYTSQYVPLTGGVGPTPY